MVFIWLPVARDIHDMMMARRRNAATPRRRRPRLEIGMVVQRHSATVRPDEAAQSATR
jgi:hypothetical protein